MRYDPQHSIGPTDVVPCSLHDQAKLDYTSLLGYINFLSVFHKTLFVPDAYFSTIPFVHLLSETDCQPLKDGIIKPLIRKNQRIVKTGEVRDIRTLSDLYDQDKGIHHVNQIFDGKITKFPLSARSIPQLTSDAIIANSLNVRVKPEIRGDIYRRIDKSATSILIDPPDIQAAYQNPLTMQLAAANGIWREWNQVLRHVKQRKGTVTLNGIYEISNGRNSPKAIQWLGDFVYNNTVPRSVSKSVAVDYPYHLRNIAAPFIERPNRSNIKFNQVRAKTQFPIDLREFAVATPGDITDIRHEISQPLFDLEEEMYDQDSLTEGKMNEVLDAQNSVLYELSERCAERKAGFRDAILILRRFSRGAAAIGIGFSIIGLSTQFPPVSYGLVMDLLAGGIAIGEALVTKKQRRQMAGEQGRRLFALSADGNPSSTVRV